jgi:flagellar hook-associated protein 3 FlgL
MRIPYDIVRDGLSSINLAAANLAAAQQQVSTGRRINAVGDDPLAAQQAVAEHAAIGSIDAYSQTVDAASARLASADSTLSSFGDKLASAVATALSAKGSTATPESRAAAAESIQSLRDSLLSDINSQFNGNSTFAGTQVNGAAYALVGGVWTYQGDSSTTQLSVDQGRVVSVTFDGKSIAQGSDASNVFTVLDDLVTAINAGDDTGIANGVAGVERAFDRTLRAQGRLGADEKGLDDVTARLATLRRAADTRRASLEDANMAEAVTKLTNADTAYHSALAAVSSVERVSLLDYLR